MVEQELIDRFKNVLASLVAEKGEVSVFALLKMDDITDRWTVVLSAPWVNDTDRGEIFFRLRSLILEKLESSDLPMLARFGIFERKEHLVELLLENFKTGDYISQGRQINGNMIHEGYILAANKEV